MPFGLCNATATFQRLMARVLAGISLRYGNVVLCYVDDILIASHTQEEHLQRLREVFGALKRAGLKLKAAKCRLLDREICFLGRKISKHGIEPDPEKIKKVHHWVIPRNKKELASQLGFAGYYREFIESYAKKIEPLSTLKRPSTPWEWGRKEQEAFDGYGIATFHPRPGYAMRGRGVRAADGVWPGSNSCDPQTKVEGALHTTD